MEFKGDSINKIPDLVSLDLKALKLASVNEPRINELKTLEVVFNGVSLNLDINNTSLFENGWVQVNITIHASTETTRNVATIILMVVTKKDRTYTATTNIENRDRGIKGLGRTLWETSLQLMQKFADEWGAPIRHEVARDFGRDLLSEDKWDELFAPILRKHGYMSKERRGFWERTYLPIKK